MTTEDDFRRLIDSNPNDWQNYLVFADWLQERDDPRAVGYRAMGEGVLRPIAAHRYLTNHSPWADREGDAIPATMWLGTRRLRFVQTKRATGYEVLPRGDGLRLHRVRSRLHPGVAVYALPEGTYASYWCSAKPYWWLDIRNRSSSPRSRREMEDMVAWAFAQIRPSGSVEIASDHSR